MDRILRIPIFSIIIYQSSFSSHLECIQDLSQKLKPRAIVLAKMTNFNYLCASLYMIGCLVESLRILPRQLLLSRYFDILISYVVQLNTTFRQIKRTNIIEIFSFFLYSYLKNMRSCGIHLWQTSCHIFWLPWRTSAFQLIQR